MKAVILLAVSVALPSCLLSSCAADAQGNKTFLGLTGPGWVGVGTDAAKAGVIAYGERRFIAVTATK